MKNTSTDNITAKKANALDKVKELCTITLIKEEHGWALNMYCLANISEEDYELFKELFS